MLNQLLEALFLLTLPLKPGVSNLNPGEYDAGGRREASDPRSDRTPHRGERSKFQCPPGCGEYRYR
jgi:hypothetical protein